MNGCRTPHSSIAFANEYNSNKYVSEVKEFKIKFNLPIKIDSKLSNKIVIRDSHNQIFHTNLYIENN
jgi:hypothetical protein